MFSSLLRSGVLLALSLSAWSAHLDNWEGDHLDVAETTRTVDWWYTQVVGQTPASNGNPPSLVIVFKHGNTFQFTNSNKPLYSVDINGFDTDGKNFAKSIQFNVSDVAPNDKGETIGNWQNGAEKIGFVASAGDKKEFKMTLDTADVKGTVVIQSNAHFRTGCGGDSVNDSPLFDKPVQDGRALTKDEDIFYHQTGWRITAPGGASSVDLTFQGRSIKFDGKGYKDSNWVPAALNDYIRSWFIFTAEVGPYSFVTFSGQAKTGENKINSGHLFKDGEPIMSQCNIIGQRQNDISVIQPSGESTEGGVVTPKEFDIKFILEDGKELKFHAKNQAIDIGVSIYHRWTAKYNGGAEGENFESFGLTEWMNPANLTHWETIA